MGVSVRFEKENIDFLADVPIKAIQRWVNENGFPGMTNFGITYMLQNEVYKGDVILQKYFTPNPLDHQYKRNDGELPRHYVENNHEPIVSKEVWQAVQDKITFTLTSGMEIEARKEQRPCRG